MLQSIVRFSISEVMMILLNPGVYQPSELDEFWMNQSAHQVALPSIAYFGCFLPSARVSTYCAQKWAKSNGEKFGQIGSLVKAQIFHDFSWHRIAMNERCTHIIQIIRMKQPHVRCGMILSICTKELSRQTIYNTWRNQFMKERRTIRPLISTNRP